MITRSSKMCVWDLGDLYVFNPVNRNKPRIRNFVGIAEPAKASE